MDISLGLLEQSQQSQQVDIEMSPIIADAHDHIIDHKVYIPDDVIGLFCGKVVGTIRFQFLQHKLIQEKLIEPIEFGEVIEYGFAVSCQDDRISDHIDDVLAVGQAAYLEVGLQNQHIFVLFQQAVFLVLIVVEAEFYYRFVEALVGLEGAAAVQLLLQAFVLLCYDALN